MKNVPVLIRNVPRFFVLLADFATIVMSFVLSYFIEKQLDFTDISRKDFIVYTVTYSAVALAVFYLMRIHTGVVRYTTIGDMFRIFGAILISSLFYSLIAELLINRTMDLNSLNTTKIILINFFVSFTALIMLRVGVRGLYYYLKHNNQEDNEKVIIYGSGPGAVIIKQALESGESRQFDVVGFLAERENSRGIYIQQKKVFCFKHLPMLKQKYNVGRLVITNDDLTTGIKERVINKCLELGIKILTVPPSDQWIYGRLKLKQIQDLRIEDLLQRDPIKISDVNVFHQLSDKRILITGAGGSIGSEIVRQVLKYRPSMLILCDQAESDLYNIQLECQDLYPDVTVVVHIATVRSIARMRIPFRYYRPEIVFHAAAYKHVPMMENHPTEAVLTNVVGTKNIADLSVLYHVERFVMISTDKAVNPTNIMGATKRIAEIYIQSLNDPKRLVHTKFMTTRFGNVLDSNGSVIPRFRAQIQAGGPVTVTHPDIVRYFMTIPEAVQLVLEAGSMGNGSEIFVFDMGKPIKINDLATNMIKLAGLVVDKDIQIIFTGLRPGEKLYEELLNDQESVLPTHHEKIKVAKVRRYDPEAVLSDMTELIQLSRGEDSKAMVRKMKEMIPEFKSQNSVFQDLDERVS